MSWNILEYNQEEIIERLDLFHNGKSKIQSLELELASTKKMLDEAVKEYKRIHAIVCEGFDYYDEVSENFLAKHEKKEGV